MKPGKGNKGARSKHGEKNKPYKLLGVRAEIWLFFIILFALFIRMYFFVGHVNNDPQDDGIYMRHARLLALGGEFSDFKWAADLVAKEDTINPAHQFLFRWMVILPITLSFMLFGLNDFSAALFPLLCSLGSIVLIFYIGKNLFNEKAGLIAAFLLSIFPLNVIYATRILPEASLTFFMALSAFMFILGEKREMDKGLLSLKNLYFTLSGVFLGIGYLTKASAVIIVSFFILYSLYRRGIRKEYLLIFIGFLMIYSVEGLYYYDNTGDFLLRPHLNSKVYAFKQDVEFKNRFKSKNFYEVVDVVYMPQLEIYPKALMNQKPLWRSKINEGFGYFYYFAIFSVIGLVILRLFGKCPKKAHIPILWALSLFLFLEFGPMSLKFNAETAFVQYLMLFKSLRYLTVLTIPSLLIIASFLSFENRIIKWIVLPLSLIILLTTSIPIIETIHVDLVSRIEGIREASKFFEAHPGARIYSDFLGVGLIKYYTGYKGNYSLKGFGYPKYSPSFTIDKIKNDSFVVAGGSRGAVSCKGVVKSLTPPFVFKPPEDWILMSDIPSRVELCRKNNWNLKIYYVPPQEDETDTA